MDTHDNLQNAEGRKEEELNDSALNSPSEQEDTLAEDSMIAESNREATEMEVSAEEDIQNTEPEFREKSEDQAAAELPSNEEKDHVGDALLEEAEKEAPQIVISDEDMEKDEEDSDIQSDEDEHDEHTSHELQMPDYGEYTPETLIAAAQKLLKEEPIQKIKDHFDAIRRNLLAQLNEERQHKLNEFLESGGIEMDFEYIQPLREKFRTVFSDYRARRQKYYADLQESLENNLRTKQDLIEKIKGLVSKEESISDTFKEFNQIQQEWRNTGPVPRKESSDLWRTYHHHVENFYEYIKINKELRDLDFKKNREAKEELIAQAEKLLENKNVTEAFKELQKLHKKWKHTGPVERENREPMWERFSDITKQMHDKRETYYAGMREKAGELVEEKKKLVAELQAMDYSNVNSHPKWQEAIKKVENIRTSFRRLGRINHPENDVIWDQFRQVLKDFNHHKNQFYKELKKSHHENLEKKRELVAIAEKLKDSEDWQSATNEMKHIQAEWKRIGHVPKSESDKIWKEFRAACNHYFDRLSALKKDQDKAFDENYTAKKGILEKLEAYEADKNDQNTSVKFLKEIIGEWKNIGKVPRSKMQIDTDFNKLLDQKFKAIDLDRKESQRIRFENKMDALTDGNDDRQLTRERQQVRTQIDNAQKELNQLETNMSFFSSSNPNNPLLKEAEKNIKQQREQIELLKEKLKMLNVKIREVNKPEEVEKEEEEEKE